MSWIDVRIVKRDHSTNPNWIPARCFFERDIVGFMSRGESTQSSCGFRMRYRQGWTLAVRKSILCCGDREGFTEQT
jgi:hypothetical protein